MSDISHAFEDISESPCSSYRPKVLIAQSDLETLDILQTECTKFDKFDFTLAHTGEEVIQHINGECFDAVVLGLRFSDITGSTLAYLIHEFDPMISMVFLTSYKTGMFMTIAEELRCGVCDKAKVREAPEEVLMEIYVAAMRTPCSDPSRTMTRDEMRHRRERYAGYRKLQLPSTIAEIVEVRKGV